jgi:tetratricopeptide (TPR) repeat protein
MQAAAFALILAFTQEATPTVDELVQRGRELLAREEPAEAEALFIEAEVRSGKALAVRKWVWRAWMQEGRINDALDAVDAIEPRGELPQADLDYLRGMAFFFRGRTYIEQNVGEPFTSMAFHDAMGWLDSATRADPEQYHDAWLPLAECAWQSHEYTIGRKAAEAARLRFPSDPHGGLLLGRVLFQHYLDLAPDPREREAADELWNELVRVLEETRETIGSPEDETARTLAADCWLQQGYAYDQKGMVPESTAAFAEAIALWPEGVDLEDLWGRFAHADFLAMLETSAARATGRFAADSDDDAVVWWWLGTARFSAATWKGSAEAYELAVAKHPAYSDAWYWAARARSLAGEPVTAVANLRAGWKADAAMLTTKLQEGGASDRTWMDGLVDWCAGERREEDRQALEAMRARAWPGETSPDQRSGIAR